MTKFRIQRSNKRQEEMLLKSFSSFTSGYTSNEIHRGSMPDEFSAFSLSAAQANYADDCRERIICSSESRGRLVFPKATEDAPWENK